MTHIERIPVPGSAGVPRVRQRMPKPFERPSVNLGGPVVKREWRTVLACEIKVGDIVPGIGLIDYVTESTNLPTGDESLRPDYWTVVLGGVEGVRRSFNGNDEMFAFVPERRK